MNGERSEPVSLPDRPGDLDQQQAAEYVPESRPEKVTRIGGQRLCGPACADALAKTREEAARWQAKIEALAEELDAEQKREMSHYSWGVRDTTARFCALLDGEQR